ncbi:uncharacterized protein LOC142982365 [Anticarsia gemmatalis]|uniref:uncharacterized protein LOC142982365 n=1 Tax=Anticarsia gemmatalis TaxID=129554 RepID=UPI003F76AD15
MIRMSVTRLCLALFAILSCCEAYRILVVFPMPGRSHSILGNGIVRHLLSDGHEVTYITPFEYKPASPKLRVIDVSDNLNAIPKDLMNLETLMNQKFDMMGHGILMFMMIDMMAKTIKNPNVQKILNNENEHFDAVITEWMFSDLPAGYATVYNCPHIWVSSMDPHWAVLNLIDQPCNPAYSGDSMSTTLPPYSFWRRSVELFTQLKAQIYKFAYFDGAESRQYEQLFVPLIEKRGRQAPPFYDVRYNASLMLANAHVSLGQAIATPQNFIAIGGYHIDENVKPLPEDLKNIMDNAKHGVIYFSMGSNLKSKDLPVELKASLLKMFGELKQTVLWKFEEDLPNTPKNVHILKWAPQPSILAHPKTVVFITHGGLLSTTETIHFGKPIIGIPVFADQFINVVRAVHRGYAVEVELSYTMADKLKAAIEEVTSNPRYAEKAKELSFVYHDRPTTPGKTLLHWVKHVITTRGALHLRSPALHVPFYQKLYLDLLVVIAIISFVLFKVFCHFCCSKKKVVSKKKRNIMTSLILLAFCLTLSSYTCDGYKALVVYPMPSRSHGILGDAVVRHLLKDGNEVVYINSFPYKNPPPNLRQIDVSANAVAMPLHAINIKKLIENRRVNEHGHIKQLMISLVVKTLDVEAVQKLLSDPNEHFDVVIVEWMFSDILAGLSAVFDCPLIWMSPVEVNTEILKLIDEAPNPAYSATVLSGNIAPFTFKQRLEELWSRLKLDYLNYMFYDSIQAEEYNKLIAPYITKRGRKPPTFKDVKYNASLVIGNSHVSLGEASTLPQNYIHIGGYHIDENLKPLPEDLKKIMDSAKHGVIYFSMGSNLKSKDWPDEVKQNLLKLFGELKQTVLWKFEEDLPNVPKNVHILKWAPQPSILSHPNCLFFISHGGLLSTIETIHYGVPIIGIPVFGDQFMNVRTAVNKGFALTVDLTLNVADDLRVAINELLSNKKYTEKVKELSFIYHDRPTKPGQELLHWVRHVVHTRGAMHLRSPALGVPLYQRLYLDLLALIVLALFFVSKLLRLVCAATCSKKIDSKKKRN